MSIFDAVMHHLHEMAGAGRTAIHIALFRPRIAAFAFLRALHIAHARGECCKNRVEPLHRFGRSADHHAIAALEPPHAAGGADIDIVQFLLGELFRAPHVILVESVAAIDDGIARLQQSGQGIDGFFGNGAGRQHHPHGAWFFQAPHQVGEIRRTHGAAAGDFLHRIGAVIINDTAMTGTHQTQADIATHSAEADDAQLHVVTPDR